FFFFQAEDGIRDPLVTGVQTCALPILLLTVAANQVAAVLQQQRAEAALRESEERFRTLAKATNDAVWDWNLSTNKVWWNEGVLRSEEHTSELQSRVDLVCRLLLEKKKK